MVDTENPIIKGVINNLASAIEALKQEIANIDEVYRKKLEEAKASLVACLAETEKQYEYWTNMSDFSTGTAAPVRKRRTRKAAVVEDTAAAPAVDDSLPFTEDEKVVDMDAVEETDAQSEEPEFDGAGFTAEDNVPPVEEPRDLDAEEDADWDEKIASGELVQIGSESSEEKEDDNDGWGEFPEEWK